MEAFPRFWMHGGLKVSVLQIYKDRPVVLLIGPQNQLGGLHKTPNQHKLVQKRQINNKASTQDLLYNEHVTVIALGRRGNLDLDSRIRQKRPS